MYDTESLAVARPALVFYKYTSNTASLIILRAHGCVVDSGSSTVLLGAILVHVYKVFMLV
jgi:hypothetical protein